jgi:hypothetical protein
MRDYAADLEPHILNILHASFGAKWGDAEFWRWKHATRPGFSPSDVVVCAAADKPIACFHLAVRTMRLAPGLDICYSIEGDFAIQPDARGTGIPQKAYRYVSPRLVSRAVLVRAGFSSRDLYEHVYKPKFGHRMPPTVTTQYRKILSDRALHAKLQEFGNAVRVRPWGQRILRAPLTVRMEVEGFQPCDLVLSEAAVSCAPAGTEAPDLKLRMPYVLLTAARMSRFRATVAVLKAILSGRVRTAGLTRVMFRGLRRGV